MHENDGECNKNFTPFHRTAAGGRRGASSSGKTDDDMNDESPEKPVELDMLERIFRMQAELNDYVFRNNDLRDAQGDPLSMRAVYAAANRGELGVNELPNAWLTRYARALREELAELDDELLWKWWSRDEIDMQNIRVELIDLLHFLVSAMICAGLTPEKVYEVYCQKHAVNVNRQDRGYSQAQKTEDDNKGIG